MQKGGYTSRNEVKSRIKPIGLWLLHLMMWQTGETNKFFMSNVDKDDDEDDQDHDGDENQWVA